MTAGSSTPPWRAVTTRTKSDSDACGNDRFSSARARADSVFGSSKPPLLKREWTPFPTIAATGSATSAITITHHFRRTMRIASLRTMASEPCP